MEACDVSPFTQSKVIGLWECDQSLRRIATGLKISLGLCNKTSRNLNRGGMITVDIWSSGRTYGKAFLVCCVFIKWLNAAGYMSIPDSILPLVSSCMSQGVLCDTDSDKWDVKSTITDCANEPGSFVQWLRLGNIFCQRMMQLVTKKMTIFFSGFFMPSCGRAEALHI